MNQNFIPEYVPLTRIRKRLPEVFPEGINHRNYLTRDIAVRTIFVMFYAGAVEGYNCWLRPNQVTRMTDAQSRKRAVKSRLSWIDASLQPNKKTIPGRWYADNTREPIRDETIRLGLVNVGAVIEREGLPTTSSLPRYALATSFADLFLCSKSEFQTRARKWRQSHLTAGALARLQLLRRGVTGTETGKKVRVTLPDGSKRNMTAGPSSIISKAVIESFAPNYLERPGLIFLSESGNKIVAADDELAQAIGLTIDVSKVLPDILLADLGPSTPILVFVEVVATDGPISESRKNDLMKLATNAGFKAKNMAFVTALADRGAKGVFRKVSSEIAWGSFVWFASEPKHIIHYSEEPPNGQYLYQMQ